MSFCDHKSGADRGTVRRIAIVRSKAMLRWAPMTAALCDTRLPDLQFGEGGAFLVTCTYRQTIAAAAVVLEGLRTP